MKLHVLGLGFEHNMGKKPWVKTQRPISRNALASGSVRFTFDAFDLILVLILGLFSPSCFGREVSHEVRFFTFDALSVNKEVVIEQFDVGDVGAGDRIKIQLFVRNKTSTELKVRSDKGSCPEIEANFNDVLIEPGDSALLHVLLVVPKNPKFLEHAFRMECMLSEKCRMICTFKAKIQGVVSFPKDEFSFELEDGIAGKVIIPIPFLLSGVDDVRRLRASCSESLSFLSVSAEVRDGKPVLLASLFPEALDRPRYRGQILLECMDLSTRCSLNFTLTRKSDFAIFPERIVLKRKPGSTELVGEAILRCHKPDSKIDSLTLKCEPSTNDTMKCEVKKINDRMGRVYFTLQPSSSNTGNRPSVDTNLVTLSDGTNDHTLFVSTFIAN